MKAKLFQNLSVNTFQLLINQLCGLIIFYLLSTQLGKADFGRLNLVLAILLMIFNLLSLGIDQVIIKKVAMHHNTEQILSVYLCHVLITGILFYIILIPGSIFIPLKTDLYPLLLVIGAGKLMIYFSTPFKQIISGLEKFKILAYMLVISNLVRSFGLTVLTLLHHVTLQETIVIFAAGDLTELIFCIYFFRQGAKIHIAVKWYKTKYLQLLKEALPQTGVVIITAAMARFDWIFIGIMVSSVKLAEYSFAYKIFEIATLPLLAIAPLLLPWFTRLFKSNYDYTHQFKFLIRIEFIAAMLTVLVLNILWVPVIDLMTAGKYGAADANTIFFLSLCIPFLYLNNFLWTIYFAQGRMRMILTGFIITFSVNAGLDVLLIPFFNNEGAAIAFLAACITQAIFYLLKSQMTGLGSVWKNLLICAGCTLIGGLIAKMCFSNCYIILVFAVVLCICLLAVTGQIRLRDRTMLNVIFNK